MAQHKRAVHEGVKYICTKLQYISELNVLATIKQLITEILLNTKEQHMKELHILAGNATIKQLQRAVLLNTKPVYMNKSNILACNATITQLQRKVWLSTKRQYVRE